MESEPGARGCGQCPQHRRHFPMKRFTSHSGLVAVSVWLAALTPTVPAQSSNQPPEPIPISELGAKAGAQYRGDGLSVSPTPGGARLRCVFQKLDGQATTEGLWLTSTAENSNGERFRVVAIKVRRATTGRPLVLARTGVVTVTDKIARCARPGLTEEYSVSVDGVRQDFVVAQRPAGDGSLCLELEVTGARAGGVASGARRVLNGSGRKLAYSRLQVVDALGKELRARIEVTEDGRMAVLVEDATATYPVRIDPTFSDADWISMGFPPGVSGGVGAAVADDIGNLYIGGSFTTAGGIPANYVAKWNGSAWSALGSGMNAVVSALAVSGTNLYAGGSFTTAGGIAANYIAKWNGSAWSALGSGMNAAVLALAVSGTNLYAGGSFTTAGGTAANSIAKWNGTTWSALGSGMNSVVYALAVSGTNLYAGGYFTTAGGIAADYIAKWNGSAWSALGSFFGGPVYALAVSGTDLNATGGDFDYYVAKWNGSAWSDLGYFSDPPYALAVSGTNLYAGGYFTTADGIAANYIAKWNGSSWSALGSGMNNQVGALAVSGTNLYAGGQFSTAGGTAANYIGKWNGSSWSTLGSGMNNSVRAFAVSGADLYAGGDFTTAGGIPANHVAKWNGSAWSALGSGIGNPGDFVSALAVSGTNLYAAAYFADYVAKWNGSTWATLGGVFNTPVTALAVSGTDVYAGGYFTTAGGTAANRIAKWNGSSWSALGSGISGNGGEVVNALAVSGTNLYAGGSFTTAGGIAANSIAKWNGSVWSALGLGIQSAVYALAVSGTNLYVGGNFLTATNTGGGTITANRIAKWNGGAWSALGLGLSGLNGVSALAVSGSDLYAGGYFTTAGGTAANNIAKWNGSAWSALGSGLNQQVLALAVATNNLYVGGFFTAAGGKASFYMAIAHITLPVYWVGGNGDWNTATNWSTGILPGPSDDVIIDVAGAVTVTHSSGTHSVNSLLTQNAFALSGGSLTVSSTIQINNTFTNSGALVATNGCTVNISSSTWGSSGTITADTSTLTFGSNWNNTGTITANASTLTFNGAWSNNGTIRATNGTVNLGGSFTQAGLGVFNRTGGTVNLIGTLSGGLTLDAATGSWLVSGTINGGTVTATGGAQLVANGGTLSGVTLGSDVSIGNSNSLAIANGLAFVGGAAITLNSSGSPSTLYVGAGIQTISGTGQIVFAGSANANYLSLGSGGATTLTMGSGVTVRGQGSILQSNSSTLLNQGTIQADASGQTLNVSITAFTNSGTLNALNGGTLNSTVVSANSASTGTIHASIGSTVSFRGSANFSGSGLLASQPSGTVRLGGSLLGGTQVPELFTPEGTTTFDGSGNAASPQFLEVMSPDGGANAAAFTGPFAYNTLSIANNSYVRLVDMSDNAAGTNAEALYANSLSLASGCTLDLNGLHVYTRASQISGTMTNGSVSDIADSGPIVLGSQTSGAITVPGELDEWTFFGRAGHNVTIAVDTGSGAVLTPKLGYADVRLVGPTNNILAQASNTVANQTVALTDVALPADGIYKIQIRAPANHPSSSGNYQVTVWEVSPDIASLTLNQTHYGNIETPYSVDRWTFSAVAGQQVQFDWINASASGVAFGLRGPNGPVGFTNLVGDSGLINLTTSGNYTLTAHGTGGAYDIAYAFRLLETIQTALPLGTNYTGQFSGSGQAQIFTITVTNTASVRITLQNSGAGNRAELYVSRSGAPTRGAFDLSSASGPGSSRTLVIPSAAVGTYYVLVYGDNIPTPGSFTIQATAAGVFVTDINPRSQGNNVPMTLTVTGSGFEAGTTVELLGGATIAATNVSVDSYSQITARFPPSSAPPGTYSVHVHQTDSDDDTLANVFEMLPPGSAGLKTRLILPTRLGRHAVATIYVEYANTGNAAMPAPLLQLHSTDPDGSDRPILTMDQSRVNENYWSAALPPGTANEVFILGSGSQPGLLNPGERIRVPVYYVGLQQPWNFSDTAIELGIRSWTADDVSPIDWAARKDSLRPSTLDATTWDVVFNNLTAGLPNTGAYIRMLSDNAQFLGRLGERITDVDKLWNFELQQAYGFTVVPTLDSSVDSSVAAPGVPLDLSRRFSSNIRARNSSGLFGRGWFSPWEATLLVQSGGDLLELTSNGDSARIFTRDSRSSSYFSGTGDSGQFVAVGAGIYELREPNGTVTRFRTDGRIDYVQDPNGNRVTAAYFGNRLTTLSHTSGAWIAIGYSGSDLIQTITNSAGRSVTYGYYPSTTYLQSMTRDDGKVTSYAYETAGTSAQRHALTSVTRGGVTRYFTFDASGRLARTYIGALDHLGGFDYDSAAGISIADALGTNQVFFNEHGQLARAVDALGNVSTSEFDDNQRLKRMTAPTGESRSFTWCSCGSMTSLIDELGNKTSFQYDNPFKRMTGFTDARSNGCSYAYDGSGNLLSTTYANNSVERSANYTTSGFPQSYTNRRGQPIVYTYTTAGQVSRQSFTNGTYADFNYDPRGNFTNVTEHTLFGTNRITTYAYSYATDGNRLRQVIYPNGRWVAFSYDSFGRRQQMTDSTGWTNHYEYDAAGRLWRMRDWTNNLMVEYLYNPAGRLQRVNKGNGSYTTYDYDSPGRLLHLTNFAPNATVNSRFDYTYDSRGRRRTMQTTDGGWTYGYDGSGQLTRAVFVSSNTNIPNQNLQYNYDAVGNRTLTVFNGATNRYVANNVNEYTSVEGEPYSYDADGNMPSDGLRTYTYDSINRLNAVVGSGGSSIVRVGCALNARVFIDVIG